MRQYLDNITENTVASRSPADPAISTAASGSEKGVQAQMGKAFFSWIIAAILCAAITTMGAAAPAFAKARTVRRVVSAPPVAHAPATVLPTTSDSFVKVLRPDGTYKTIAVSDFNTEDHVLSPVVVDEWRPIRVEDLIWSCDFEIISSSKAVTFSVPTPKGWILDAKSTPYYLLFHKISKRTIGRDTKIKETTFSNDFDVRWRAGFQLAGQNVTVTMISGCETQKAAEHTYYVNRPWVQPRLGFEVMFVNLSPLGDQMVEANNMASVQSNDLLGLLKLQLTDWLGIVGGATFGYADRRPFSRWFGPGLATWGLAVGPELKYDNGENFSIRNQFLAQANFNLNKTWPRPPRPDIAEVPDRSFTDRLFIRAGMLKLTGLYNTDTWRHFLYGDVYLPVLRMGDSSVGLFGGETYQYVPNEVATDGSKGVYMNEPFGGIKYTFNGDGGLGNFFIKAGAGRSTNTTDFLVQVGLSSDPDRDFGSLVEWLQDLNSQRQGEKEAKK